MASSRNSTTKRPANRFYSGAKISEYQFKRVLWTFVRDEPVAEAAKHIDLSANSINAIYAKLRVFFTELGIFEDIYEGRDPRAGTGKGEDFEGFEYRLIPFHLERVKAKRRAKPTVIAEVDYHWNESYWRFLCSILTEGRHSEAIDRMMYAHLLALIRACGPVGRKPRNLEQGAALKREQFEQRLLWLERNSPNFSEPKARTTLREILEEGVSTEPYRARDD